MPSTFEVKGQARLLAQYLAEIGHDISHSHSLEAIARINGAKSWNVFAPTLTDPTDWSNPTSIFEAAFRDEATNVHFRWSPTEGLLHFRCRGALVEVARLPARQSRNLLARITALFELEGSEHESGYQELVFGDDRVLVTCQSLALDEAADYVFSLKLLTRHAALSKLGLSCSAQWFDAVNNHNSGLFLVGGVTGSGKSTTLNATLRDMLAVEPDNRILEAAGYVDKEVIKTMMRSDPDVVVIPEIRDMLSYEQAMDMVKSGVKVLSTIHASGAPEVLARLHRHFGATHDELFAYVNGILYQSLKCHPCEYCVAGQPCAHCKGTRHGEQYREAVLLTGSALQQAIKRC